jgi:hypothetical protein
MNRLSQQVAQALLLELTGWLRWLYRENPNIKPVENNMNQKKERKWDNPIS